MEANQAPDRVVIALAGRRIDAPDTDPPRFPLENVPIVRQRLVDIDRRSTQRRNARIGCDPLEVWNANHPQRVLGRFIDDRQTNFRCGADMFEKTFFK